MFAKQFRLRTMTEWDANSFEDALGKKVQWGIISGRPFSGKEDVSKTVCSLVKGKRIDMKQMAEDLKKKLAGPDDEEVEVPIEKVEESILELVSADRSRNEKFCYIFDDWLHKTCSDFINAIHQEFGLPNFAIQCTADKKTIEERWKKANEADDVGEDAQAELAEQATKDEENLHHLDSIFKEAKIASKLHQISCETLEGANQKLRGLFSAKVILVNHEKRLEVDTVCSNLSIKYNMLYMSVYQLIK